MTRFLLVSPIVLGLLAGCAQQPGKMEEMKKPAVPPEMAKLQCWVGNWSGTAEMISPSPEEMKKMMPAGAKEMPKTMSGAEKVEWVLGGMALRSEGWFEMGEGMKVNYVYYVMWDAKAGKFHGWSFADWGEIGESWTTVDPSGRTFRMTEKAIDAHGRPSTNEGVTTFVDDKTADSTLTLNGPQGTMKLKGTNKKQP
jgi:hypothetical protein